MKSFIVSIKRPSQIIPKLNPSFKAVSSIFFVTFCGKYSIKPNVEERGNKFSSFKNTSIFLSNPKTGISSNIESQDWCQLLWQIASLSRNTILTVLKWHDVKFKLNNCVFLAESCITPFYSCFMENAIWDRTA